MHHQLNLFTLKKCTARSCTAYFVPDVFEMKFKASEITSSAAPLTSALPKYCASTFVMVVMVESGGLSKVAMLVFDTIKVILIGSSGSCNEYKLYY